MKAEGQIKSLFNTYVPNYIPGETDEAQIQRWYETLMEGKKAGGRIWVLYRKTATQKAKTDPIMRAALARAEQQGE